MIKNDLLHILESRYSQIKENEFLVSEFDLCSTEHITKLSIYEKDVHLPAVFVDTFLLKNNRRINPFDRNTNCFITDDYEHSKERISENFEIFLNRVDRIRPVMEEVAARIGKDIKFTSISLDDILELSFYDKNYKWGQYWGQYYLSVDLEESKINKILSISKK